MLFRAEEPRVDHSWPWNRPNLPFGPSGVADEEPRDCKATFDPAVAVRSCGSDLAQNTHTQPPIKIDEKTGEEIYIMSYIIQGCVASALIKHTKHNKGTNTKMPLQTIFNPELHAQEYNKNYMYEYIKSTFIH